MTLKATIAIEPLMTALEALNGFQFDVTLHVDAEGLRAGVVNSERIFVATISFPPEAFRSFEFKGPSLSLLMCVSEFLTIRANDHKEAELLHLRVHKGSNKLWYHFSEDPTEMSPARGSYTAVPSPKEPIFSDCPFATDEIDFEATFRAVSPVDCFTRLIAEVESWFPQAEGVYLRSIELKPRGDGFISIYAENSAGKTHSRHLYMDVLGLITDITCQGEPLSTYDPHYIRLMGLPLAEIGEECQLTWEFDTDTPILATYAFKDGAHIKFVLAPRIRDRMLK